MSTDNICMAKEKKGAVVIPAYAWIILFVTMLAGVTAPLNQFKVPPMMPVLMEKFQLDLSTASLLMSVFAITGLVLALPAGIISQKLGAKVTGLIALGCLLVGAATGAIAASADVLLASRLIEGAGMGLIAVVAPAVINSWFPPEKRGLPMGIWATWVSLGSLIIYNLAPALNRLADWRAVWWAGAVFALVALGFYGLLIRVPPAIETVSPKADQTMPGLKQSLANRNIWLLALAFGCFNFVLVGVIATFFPTFLKSVRGYSLADASFITSLKMVAVILAAPLAGWLSDTIASPKRVILVSLAALAGFMVFPFSITGWLVPLSMVVLGIIAGSLPSATFAAVPEVMGDGRMSGIGIGVIMVGQNLGQLVGPVIFSSLVESTGWVTAGYWTIAVVMVGLVATWFTKMR
jgi:MFS family permease